VTGFGATKFGVRFQFQAGNKVWPFADEGLEQLLARGVDLVEPGAVRNPYVLAGINRHREPVYAA
jgi:predicted nucleotidyltransferase